MDDIELVRGDSEVLTVTIRDADEVLVPLGGASAWFTMKRRLGDADADAVVAKTDAGGIVITTPGILTISIDPDDTDALLPGTYRYDVQIAEASGRVSTVAFGRVRLGSDVTRTT